MSCVDGYVLAIIQPFDPSSDLADRSAQRWCPAHRSLPHRRAPPRRRYQHGHPEMSQTPSQRPASRRQERMPFMRDNCSRS